MVSKLGCFTGFANHNTHFEVFLFWTKVAEWNWKELLIKASKKSCFTDLSNLELQFNFEKIGRFLLLFSFQILIESIDEPEQSKHCFRKHVCWFDNNINIKIKTCLFGFTLGHTSKDVFPTVEFYYFWASKETQMRIFLS